MQLMNNQNNSLLAKLPQFMNQLKKSGKTPEQMLDELIKSGKVTKEQLEQATNMAKLFQGLIK